jgi:hypothetical protein
VSGNCSTTSKVPPQLFYCVCVLSNAVELLAARAQTQPRRPARTLTATWMACRASPPPAASDMALHSIQLQVCLLLNVYEMGNATV